jgi:HK97 family phage prohead protease
MKSNKERIADVMAKQSNRLRIADAMARHRAAPTSTTTRTTTTSTRNTRTRTYSGTEVFSVQLHPLYGKQAPGDIENIDGIRTALLKGLDRVGLVPGSAERERARHEIRDAKSFDGFTVKGPVGAIVVRAMAREDRDRTATFPMTLRSSGGPVGTTSSPSTAESGDGQTLEGYAAVFNAWTDIRDQLGAYKERIAPGSFRRSIGERMPVMQFDHGGHPLIGSLPLGTISTLREDKNGLFVRARLSDNWLVEPFRDAIRDRAVSGMSFRFRVRDDEWSKVDGQDARTIKDVELYELGPVVMPAYRQTSVFVRSLLSGGA